MSSSSPQGPSQKVGGPFFIKGFSAMKKNLISNQRFDSREVFPSVVQRLLSSCNIEKCFQHLGSSPLPSGNSIAQALHRTRCILFPGYFTQNVLSASNLEYCLHEEIKTLYKEISNLIILADQHDCLRYDKPCAVCEETGSEKALAFIQALPELREILATDVRAAMEGDPAAKGYDEIITSYPGLFAVAVQRISHKLHELSVLRLPRAMTEYAHSVTGIDIHPGARIGNSIFIDHGTGVVIGETTEIGNRVRIYQGVTLGALSMPATAVESFRNKKRHPTIEDDVIIYSNTTILGGDTIIGARSTIGGNVWITESVPPDTKVYLKKPELIFSGNGSRPAIKENKNKITSLFRRNKSATGC